MGRMRTVLERHAVERQVVVGRVDSAQLGKILFPDVLHLRQNQLDSLWMRFSRSRSRCSSSGSYMLRRRRQLCRLHDLHVELHVLVFFLPIMMASWRWKWISVLISFKRAGGELDVAVDDVHLFVCLADVPQTVGVRLEGARLAPAASRMSAACRPARRHASMREHQPFLAHQRQRSFFSVSGRHCASGAHPCTTKLACLLSDVR